MIGSHVDNRRQLRLASLSLALGVAVFFVLAPVRFRFWFDSWTYLELAQTFGRDFYAITTIREFGSGSAYSSAFPPLWPALVALFAKPGLGMLGAYVAAFLSFAAFAAAAERFARRLFSMSGIGLLSALLVLAFPGMRWDLGGGGSIALFLCFIALLGTLLLELDVRRSAHALALGALAGLLIMLRFDAAPASLVALVAGVALGFRGRQIVLMTLAFALVISPWVAYSWMHFHAPFVTDNRLVALALDPDAYVMDVHPTPRPTLADDPSAWFHKLIVHAPLIADAIADAVVESVFLIPLAFLALGTWLVRRPRLAVENTMVPSTLRSRGFLALCAIEAAPFAAYVVTGYQESRYFSMTLWLAELSALGVWFVVMSARWRLVVFSFVCAAGVAKSVALVRYRHERPPLATMRAQLSTADVDSVTACLSRAGATKDDGVLFRTNIRFLNGYRFGALSGWRAAPSPRNWLALTPAQRADFVRKHRLAFVIDTLPSGGDRLPTEPVAGCSAAVRRLGPGSEEVRK